MHILTLFTGAMILDGQDAQEFMVVDTGNQQSVHKAIEMLSDEHNLAQLINLTGSEAQEMIELMDEVCYRRRLMYKYKPVSKECRCTRSAHARTSNLCYEMSVQKAGYAPFVMRHLRTHFVDRRQPVLRGSINLCV